MPFTSEQKQAEAGEMGLKQRHRALSHSLRLRLIQFAQI